MPFSQEVERIFKLRQQFKECGGDYSAVERESPLDSPVGKSKRARISDISELIRKFKE